MANVSVDDNGLMAAVFAPTDEIHQAIDAVDGYVVVANLNSSKQAVIGGASVLVTVGFWLIMTKLLGIYLAPGELFRGWLW